MEARKRPTVLFLVGWYFPDSVGGTEMYVQCLAHDLQEKGWNVLIAAPSRDENQSQYEHDGVPVFRYPITLKPDRMELRFEKKPVYFDVFENWLFNHKPDIIHMHSFTRGCGYFHAKLARQLGVPLIITIHAADFLCVGGTSMRWGEVPCDGKINAIRCTSCWIKKCGVIGACAWLLARVPMNVSSYTRRLNNKFGTTFSMYRLFLEREAHIQEIFEEADQIVAVSKWLYYAMHLNGVPHEKIILCRHGLPQEFMGERNMLDTKKTPDLLRVGFLGRFNRVKGLHVLINAVQGLPRTLKIKVMISGRANNVEEEMYYYRLKKRIAHDQRFVLCGEVTKENRKDFFRSIDCLAIPSVWFETGPLVALEAFAAGVPVIGSNLGGIAELIENGKNGILVPVGDVKAWRDSIHWMCENPETIQNMRMQIPPVRSSAMVADEMSNLYQRYLKR